MKNKCYFCGKDAIGEFKKSNRCIIKISKCKKCAEKNITGYSNLIFELVREGSINEAILSQYRKEDGETYFRGHYMTIEEFYVNLTVGQLEEINKTEYSALKTVEPWAKAAIKILNKEK